MSAILIDAFARAEETDTLEVDGERWCIVRVPYAGDIREAVLEHLRASMHQLRSRHAAELARDIADDGFEMLPPTAGPLSKLRVQCDGCGHAFDVWVGADACRCAACGHIWALRVAGPLAAEADDEYVQPDAAPAVDWHAALEDDGG